MKQATPAMLAILNGKSSQYLMADLWKFQLTNGTTLLYTNADFNVTLLTSFSRSTIGTYTGSDGLVATAAINVPRYNYSVFNPPSGSFLFEAAATNICLYSQDYSNAVWDAFDCAVTSNYAVAPDGTNTASRMLAAAGSANNAALQEGIVGSGLGDSQTHTISGWIKSNTANNQNFSLKLTQKAVQDNYSADLIASPVWKRFSFSFAFSSGGDGFIVGVAADSNGDALDLQVWGIQLEKNSASATSYIPTTSAAFTRAADVVTDEIYYCNDVICDGGKVDWTTGLEVGSDEIVMNINNGTNPSVVGSIMYATAVIGGLFDRALVTRSRVFMTTWGNTTPGAVVLFVGEISTAKLTQNVVTMDSKDLRNLLNIYMPSRQYQPTCPFVFGDSNCTFDRSTIAVNSTVTGIAGSTIACALSQAAGFFNNGVIKFTSGNNAGEIRSIKVWSPGLATIVAPFPVPPAIGDTFTITPGCTKNFAGAQNAYAAAAQTGSTPNRIITALSNAAGYFNGGTLQFTSGLNVGQSVTITNWANGVATMAAPFGNAPALGDECEVTAISTNTTNSCTGHFGSNANIHFGGQRFLPVPETSY